jgi:hypothetical protein
MSNYEAAMVILKHYGASKQELQAVQELSELIILLTKRPDQRGEEYQENLIDEIADATIMIEQVKMMHGIDNKDVSARISYKLYRQMCRIEQEAKENA